MVKVSLPRHLEAQMTRTLRLPYVGKRVFSDSSDRRGCGKIRLKGADSVAELGGV